MGQGAQYELVVVEKIDGSRKKFSGGERRAERKMRLFRTGGLAELRQVASGSATLTFR